MKLIVCSVLAPFLLTTALYAQSDTKAACPSIMVTVPGGILSPGEFGLFTAQVDPIPTLANVKISWRISDGEIYDGQGTYEIKVKIPESLKVTATVIIEGLPKNCPNTASDIFQVSGPEPVAEKIGTASYPTRNIPAELMKEIGTSMRDQPSSQLYVILYIDEADSVNAKRDVEKFIKANLSRMHIDTTRLTLVTADLDAKEIHFWLVPPSASNPAP